MKKWSASFWNKHKIKNKKSKKKKWNWIKFQVFESWILFASEDAGGGFFHLTTWNPIRFGIKLKIIGNQIPDFWLIV